MGIIYPAKHSLVKLSSSGIYNKTSNETTTLNKLSNILLYVECSSSVIGLLGNVIVCLVILCTKSMHTVTNCYLFSLSISDLLLLINGTIHDVYILNKAIIQPDVSILYALSEIPMCISIATVTVFTVERYLAICHPLYTYKTSEVRRTVKILIVLWMTIFLIASPRGVIIIIRATLKENGTNEEIFHGIMFYLHCMNTVLFLVLPIFVITLSYILIGLRMSETNRMRRDHSSAVDSTQKANLIVMGIIIIATIICWLPVFVIEIIDLIRLTKDHSFYLNTSMYLVSDEISNFLLRLSPVINPVIYSAMSSKFRAALKEFATCCNGSCLDWRSRFIRNSSNNSSSHQNSSQNTGIPA